MNTPICQKCGVNAHHHGPLCAVPSVASVLELVDKYQGHADQITIWPVQQTEVEAVFASWRLMHMRLSEMSQVPCAAEWSSGTMRCYPADRCSFCRVRALLAGRP